MLASRTLTPGAADAVSTGSTLGLYTQLDARAPVASDNRYPLAEVSVTEKLALLPPVTLGGTYCRILAKSYG